MQKSRWIIIIAISMAVIVAIVYGFMPRPVSVDIAKASRGQLTVTIEEEGKTRVKDRFVISAAVSGFMRRIAFDVGDHVKKGQVVVKLEPLRSPVLDPRSRAEAKAAVSAAEASLKAAEENARAMVANAEYSKSNLERIKKLFVEGYVSKDAFERAGSEAKRTEANLLSAEAAVNVARFELDRSRAALRYSTAEGITNHDTNHGRIVAMHTPVDGRVLKIHRESEGVVSSGEPLIDIGDPGKLEVKVEVLSVDAVKIKIGTPVFFERWGGDPALGKVRLIEPAGFTKISALGVEEQRVRIVADIISPPESWQRLGDGYSVDARFIIWEGKDILQIPAGALFRKDKYWAVFVVKNKRAHLRQVEIGHRTGLVAEIVSGIFEGEMVIMHPDELIKDGTYVRMR
jgi:HlyD family secretion protein